jgi:nucleoside-diphosphate-sugar epimerase
MILVTGGTGLTGSHLLYELTRRDFPVRALRRRHSSTDYVRNIFSLYSQTPDALLAKITWIDADLLDFDSLIEATRGIDTVYHAGAYVSFDPSKNDLLLDTNVRGTANLVDACLLNGVREICHISSVAALGEANESGIIDENCLWTKSKGQSSYAKSKFWGEMEIWRAAEQGVRVVIVNPSVILGPGRWDSGSGQLFSTIAKGIPFYTEGVTGYVDVRDVARAMVLLMANPDISGEKFILNSENVSYKFLFTAIARSVNRKPPRIRIEPWVIKIAYPIAKFLGFFVGRGAAISRENLRSAFTKSYYSSRKITARIGFEFIPVAESIQFIGNLYKQGFR